MKLAKFAIVCGAALTLAPATHASVTQLFSATDMSTVYVNDFETSLNGGPVTISNAHIFDAASASHSVTTSGSKGMLSDSFPTFITASLANPFSAVGLHFGNDDLCCSNGFNATLEVFQGATSLGSVSVAANMNDHVDQFIGLSSTVAFDRVTLSYGAHTGLYIFADDFRVGHVAAVPEPQTLALTLAGFAVVGAIARRKTVNPAA